MIGPVISTSRGLEWNTKFDFNIECWVAPNNGNAVVVKSCIPDGLFGAILYVAGHRNEHIEKNNIISLECEICNQRKSISAFFVGGIPIHSCYECYDCVMKIDVIQTPEQQIICYEGEFLMFSCGIHGFEKYFKMAKLYCRPLDRRKS